MAAAAAPQTKKQLKKNISVKKALTEFPAAADEAILKEWSNTTCVVVAAVPFHIEDCQ
jgi:hypothetical protein